MLHNLAISTSASLEKPPGEAAWGYRCESLPTDVGWVISVGIEMFSRHLDRMRGILLKKKGLPNTPTSRSQPTTLIDSLISRRKTQSQRSTPSEVAPPFKRSGLDKVLEFIHPPISKPSAAKLKIAPSGAIVFTPVRSQESSRSSLLPGTSFPQINIRKLTSEHSRDFGCTIYPFQNHKTPVNTYSRRSKRLQEEK